jgi:hypothetical protein
MSKIQQWRSKPLRFWLRFVAVLVVVLIALNIIYVPIRDSIYAEQDRLAVAVVDAQLAREIGEDPQLQEELGRFIRLEGKNYGRREHVWMMWPRIEWWREAVFENGRLRVNVTLSADESYSLGKKQWEISDWDYVDFSAVPPAALEVKAHPLSKFYPNPDQVALSGDAARLVITGSARCEVWDTNSRQLIRSIKGKFGPLQRIAYANGTGKVAISSYKSTRIVDPDAGTSSPKWPNLITADDKRHPIAISRDGNTVIGNIRDPKQKRAIPDHLAFEPGALPRVIANIHQEGRIKPVIATTMPDERPVEVFLSPDGNYAMLGLSKRFAEVWWDVRHERAISETPIGDTSEAVRKPWEGRVVFGPLSGDAFVWRKVAPFAPPLRLTLPDLTINVRYEKPNISWESLDRVIMAVSPDERWLGMVTPYAIHLWDASTGRFLRENDQQSFRCWMTISSETGQSLPLGSSIWPLNLSDAVALSIGVNGSLKLVTHSHRGVQLWTGGHQ